MGGTCRNGGAVGVDAELDHQVEQDGNRLAVFDGGLECGFADGVDGVFVEAEADGTGHGDFAGLAVGANHDVILADAGDAMVLRELVRRRARRWTRRAFLSTMFWRSTAGSCGR